MAASTSMTMSSTSTTRSTILHMISAVVPFILFQFLFLLMINNVDGHNSSDIPLHDLLLQVPPPPPSPKNESNIGVGFSMEILHTTYSRKSPLYNPNATLLERAIDLVRRSNLRAQNYYYRTEDLTTPAKSADTSLLGVFDVGTPPVRSVALLDTGSSLLWLQCRPCNCYKQIPDVYDPVKSRSYTQVKCSDIQYCRQDYTVHCNYSNRVNCSYSIRYLNKFISAGDMVKESFTFGDGTKLPNIVFGCGHENVGDISEKMSGVFGLGTGVNSVLSQLKVSKLSFCFPRIDKEGSGQLRFGSSAIFSKRNMIQMYPKSSRAGYEYLLPLESIYVQGFGFLDYPPGLFVPREDGTGGLMFDSGTSVTRLYPEAYTALISAVAQSIGDKLRRVYEHPTELELCYEAPSSESVSVATPPITLRFIDTGIFYWTADGTFIQVDNNIWCLALLKADTPMAYLGSFQMQGSVVGLDLATNQLSFSNARFDCSKP